MQETPADVSPSSSPGQTLRTAGTGAKPLQPWSPTTITAAPTRPPYKPGDCAGEASTPCLRGKRSREPGEQIRRASRVLSPSPPWRGGPESQHPSLLPCRPPHVKTHACSGSQDGACALAPAAERPCRLPPSAFAGSRARRGSEPVERKGRGGAGRGTGAERRRQELLEAGGA